MTEDRAVTTDFSEGDQSEKHVRPQLLDDFVGQSALRENLDVFVKAARDRREAMDHVFVFWASRSWKDDTGANRGS